MTKQKIISNQETIYALSSTNDILEGERVDLIEYKNKIKLIDLDFYYGPMKTFREDWDVSINVANILNFIELAFPIIFKDEANGLFKSFIPGTETAGFNRDSFYGYQASHYDHEGSAFKRELKNAVAYLYYFFPTLITLAINYRIAEFLDTRNLLFDWSSCPLQLDKAAEPIISSVLNPNIEKMKNTFLQFYNQNHSESEFFHSTPFPSILYERMAFIYNFIQLNIIKLSTIFSEKPRNIYLRTFLGQNKLLDSYEKIKMSSAGANWFSDFFIELKNTIRTL